MATDNSLGEKMIAAVDLGSSKIALAVARVRVTTLRLSIIRRFRPAAS